MARSHLFQNQLTSSHLLQYLLTFSYRFPGIDSVLFWLVLNTQFPLPINYHLNSQEIKQDILSSLTKHLYLLSFFAITVISLPCVFLVSCTVDWHLPNSQQRFLPLFPFSLLRWTVDCIKIQFQSAIAAETHASFIRPFLQTSDDVNMSVCKPSLFSLLLFVHH